MSKNSISLWPKTIKACDGAFHPSVERYFGSRQILRPLDKYFENSISDKQNTLMNSILKIVCVHEVSFEYLWVSEFKYLLRIVFPGFVWIVFPGFVNQEKSTRGSSRLRVTADKALSNQGGFFTENPQIPIKIQI